MTKVLTAFADGWGRVLRAPAILLGAFAITWLVAFPAWRLRELAGLIGEIDDRVMGPATGFFPAFTPTLLGTGRFLSRAYGFFAGGARDVDVVAAVATTLVVWTFLLGGILDRYARRRPTRSQAFFGASGVFFFRFLRLGVIAALGDLLLFGVVHPLLFPPDYPWVAAGGATTPASPLLTPVFAVFLLFATFWSAVIDYSRIRAVVEDRRSMLGALLAGWRFVIRHPLETFGLYLLNAAAFGLILWITLMAFTSGSTMVASGRPLLSAGSVFLLARVVLKLVFFASQTAFFQRSLAHVDYTAAPTPLWPESPSAEEIINAAPRAN